MTAEYAYRWKPLEPLQEPARPLVLVAEEEIEPQRERFLKWVDEVVVIALSEWKKKL